MKKENSSCGKLLSIAEQCEFFSISKTALNDYVKTDPTFPPAFAHPLAKGRKVRSQIALQAWLDKKYEEIVAA